MKKSQVILTPQAREDITQIAAYIGQNNTQASMVFRHTLENIYDVLLALPQMGRVRNFGKPELEGLRMLPIPKFENHLIFYHATSKGLEIVRVLHGARDLPPLFE